MPRTGWNIPALGVRAVGTAICFWLGNVGYQYLAASAAGWGALEDVAAVEPGAFFAHALSTQPLGLSFERNALVAGALVALFTLVFSNARGTRYDNEIPFDHQYDTATWATAAQARALAHTEPYLRVGRAKKDWPKPAHMEELADDNILMAKGCLFAASNIPDFETEQMIKNRHGWVQAISGSGKTYAFLTSNALNLLGSYFFLDPKGEIFERFANFYESHGYRALVLDLRDDRHMEFSCRFNPLAYIDCMYLERGMDYRDFRINFTSIDTIVDMFVNNTKGKDTQGDQQYFIDMEKAVYRALIGMQVLRYKSRGNLADCTFPALIDWLAFCGGNMDDEANLDDLDRIFYGTWERDRVFGLKEFICAAFKDGEEVFGNDDTPWHYVYKNYETFKSCRMAEETKAGVVSSCFSRLQRFLNPTIRSLMSSDDFDLENFGREKRVVFCCIPSGDEGAGPYGFLASMFLNLLFKKQEEVAQASGGRVPIPEWYFLDEVANLPKIPELPELYGIGRGYGMNLCAIVQNESTMENRYGKAGVAQIRDNTAYQLYLGFRNAEDAKRLSESIGYTTKVVRTVSQTVSQTGSSTTNGFQAVREPLCPTEQLMTFNTELPGYRRGLAPGECIAKVGVMPYFRGPKLDPTTHPRWPELERAGHTTIEEWQRAKAAPEPPPEPEPRPAQGAAAVAVDPRDPNTIIVPTSA